MTGSAGQPAGARLVVGLVDDGSAQVAVDWVIERAASRDPQVLLVAELDPHASNPDAARALLSAASDRIRRAAPGTAVETSITDRPLLHELLDLSTACDLLVIGSHPDPRMRESRTPSFPVSLTARSRCAVVVVPDDWQARDGAVVVGVDATDAGAFAAMFAAREAVDARQSLDIVHTWEPWTAVNASREQFAHEQMLAAVVERVRLAFPSLRVQGILQESVAHKGVIASSRTASLLVLGTHGLGRVTGLVLGAIQQEVMISGRVALCIVPLAAGTRAEAPLEAGLLV